jgi:hypothetical protein
VRQREEIQKVLRKTSLLIPAGIVLFWAVMMGLLIYREVILPWSRFAPVSRRSEKAQDLWMGVYTTGGDRIGFVNSRSNPGLRESGKGMELGLMARIETSLFGVKTEFSLTGSAWMDSRQGLQNFDFSLRSGEHKMRVEGALKGKVLEARLHTAGEEIPFTFPVGDAVLLSGGMGMPSLDVPLLEPGREAYVDSFDPTTMSMGKALIACTGKETLEAGGTPVETFVITTTIGGITTKAWVTAEEEVIRAETPFGFVLKKLTPQEAMAPMPPGETASLVSTMAVRPTGKTPQPGARELWVRFSGVDEAHLPPSDGVQTRTAQGYIISTPKLPSGPVDPEVVKQAPADTLAADMFVQSDHPKIKDTALKAVGDETDLWQRAVKLHDWVYLNIKKSPVISVPSALDVLRTLEGDCNEHTVLFTALARSLGIPARIAIGLVWSDELGGFGYHAWPEVYIGTWMPMDPTFGQMVADATHIKLLNGGIDKWSQLLPFIGQLRIEVLGVE